MIKLLLLDTTGGALGLLAQSLLSGFDKNLEISCSSLAGDFSQAPKEALTLAQSPFLPEELSQRGLSLKNLLSSEEKTAQSWDYILILTPEPLDSLKTFFQNHPQQRSLLILPPLKEPNSLTAFHETLEQFRAKLRSFYLKELLSESACSCGAHSFCRCS